MVLIRATPLQVHSVLEGVICQSYYHRQLHSTLVLGFVGYHLADGCGSIMLGRVTLLHMGHSRPEAVGPERSKRVTGSGRGPTL